MLERFLVLGLRERVDRAELLAAALQALDRLVQLGALVRVQRCVGRLRLEAELGRELRQLLLDVLRMVAGALRLHLAARDGLAALAQPAVDAGFFGRALTQLLRELLPRGLVGVELGLQDLDAVRHRGLDRLQRRREPLRDRLELLVALEPLAFVLEPPGPVRALAVGPFLQPSLHRDLRLDLRLAIGARALVGRGTALLDDPARVPLGLGGLIALATGGAGLTIDRLARGVGLGDLRLRLLDRVQRGSLGARDLVDLADERVATVALLEHAVMATRADLPQLARPRRPHAPVLGDRDAVERRVEPVDGLDDPHVREDRGGKPLGAVVAGGRDVRGERLGAVRGGATAGEVPRRPARRPRPERSRARPRLRRPAQRRRPERSLRPEPSRAGLRPARSLRARSARLRRPCRPWTGASRAASRSSATPARRRGPSAADSASS